MISILKEHLKKYPKMQPQDAIKLVYQATFGANHIISDEAQSLALIEGEWQNNNIKEPFENIGNGYIRAHINAFEKNELPLLNKLFIMGAQKKEANMCLEPVSELFGSEAVNQYLKNGIAPISHSPLYKEEYKPAYRVLPKIYADYYSIILKVYTLRPRVIAIDGRAGAGKSTLAQILAGVLECPVIKMDHFFLPPNLRTEARLSTAGGNIHYERFKEQVVNNLGGDITYGVFDCSVMQITENISISHKKTCIVEGSYSMHPYFEKYYNLGIFLSVPKAEQEQRILKRNGAQILKMFKEKWIPMEEKYIKEFNIENKAEITFR